MSADGLRVGLEQLMAQWREQSAKDRDHGDSYRIGRGWGLEECADEVAALLHAHPPAPDEEEDISPSELRRRLTESRTGLLPRRAVPPAPDFPAQIRALPRNAHTITRNDGLTWKIEYVAWADLAALLPPEEDPS